MNWKENNYIYKLIPVRWWFGVLIHRLSLFRKYIWAFLTIKLVDFSCCTWATIFTRSCEHCYHDSSRACPSNMVKVICYSCIFTINFLQQNNHFLKHISQWQCVWHLLKKKKMALFNETKNKILEEKSPSE